MKAGAQKKRVILFVKKSLRILRKVHRKAKAAVKRRKFSKDINVPAQSLRDEDTSKMKTPNKEPPTSVDGEAESSNSDEQQPKLTDVCVMAIALEEGLRTGTTSAQDWAVQHRKAAAEDPLGHRSCHRMIWQGVDLLEGRPFTKDGLSPAQSAMPMSDETREAVTALMREICALCQSRQFNFRAASGKLRALLLQRPTSTSLREVVAICRAALHRRHMNEHDNMVELVAALGFLAARDIEVVELHERVSLMRQCLFLKPADPDMIGELASGLRVLYERTSNPDVLLEASTLDSERAERAAGIDCAVLSGIEDELLRESKLRDVMAWILLHRRMVDLAPKTHARCAGRLAVLARSLHEGGLDRPDHVLAVVREAVHLVNVGIGHSDRLSVINQAVQTLRVLQPSVESAEIKWLQAQAYALVCGSAYRTSQLKCLPERLQNINRLHRPVFPPKIEEQTASTSNAAMMIQAMAEAMESKAPTLRWVNPLQAEHIELHKPAERIQDIHNMAVRAAVSRAAIDAMPAGPLRAQALVANALALLATNLKPDIENSVAVAREAVACWGVAPGMSLPEGHPARRALGTLSQALYTKHQLVDASLESLRESVLILRGCLNGLEKSQTRFPYLYPLSAALLALFRRLGQREDIITGINCLQDLLQQVQSAPDMRMVVLAGIGKSLDAFFDAYGGITVIDEAAATVRESLQLTPSGHPLLANSLSLLGCILRKRYVLLQAHIDLKASVDLNAAAMKTSRAMEGFDTDLATYVAAQGESAMVVYDEFHRPKDLQVAEDAFRQVMEVRESLDIDRAESLHRLSVAMRKKYAHSSHEKDLDEAISLARQSLQTQFDSQHPRYFFWASALAAALLLKAKIDRPRDRIAEVVSLYQSAVANIPSTHPGLANVLAGFAETLYTRYEATKDSDDLDQTFALYAKAATCPSSPNRICFGYARTWEILASRHDHHSLADAFDVGLYHQSRIVSLGRTVQSRHEFLARDEAVDCSRAAAHALREGHIERAVALLERGRSIVWQQTLHLRSSMDDLRRVSPSLADQLSATVAELEGISRVQSVSYHAGTYWSRTDPDRTARYHRELAEKFESQLAEVRQLEGFHDFMHTTVSCNLDGIARDGPVVIINVCRDRSDAIILTELDGLRHVHLSTAVEEEYRAVQDELAEAAEALEKIHEDYIQPAKRLEDALLHTLRLLWATAVEPIILELQSLGPLPSRLFWCVSGVSDMPFHAAGPYVDGQDNLPDMLTSSYTPTLTALLRARHTARPILTAPLKIVAIAQSSTAGYGDLPEATNEIRALKDISPYPITELVDDSATPGAVLAALRTHGWAHFCCHGTVNAHQPLLSSFHLRAGHDIEALSLADFAFTRAEYRPVTSSSHFQGSLNVEALMRADLPLADFAFLSACHTALGSAARNESMSLAAAMQVAGFRSIIATMYSIVDMDGPFIAREVYKYLFRDECSVTSSDAAVALNRATAVLRQSGVPMFRWVPFIHMGI